MKRAIIATDRTFMQHHSTAPHHRTYLWCERKFKYFALEENIKISYFCKENIKFPVLLLNKSLEVPLKC